jgi:peptidoglycan/LPS O-acetylase OafA/YrhL
VTQVASEQDTRELRRHTTRLDIQGLRAVAVIVVVAFHAGLPVPGGFIGVDVFFVISGFVITGMLMRQLASDGRLSFSRFYARRIKRLVPALALVLMVTLGMSFLLGSPFDGQQTTTGKTAIGAILMFANGVVFLQSGGYFATPPTNNPLLNTWSLSVEEQFYLLFPALLVALWWLSRRGRQGLPRDGVLIAGIGVGAVLSFALCLGMSYGAISYRFTDPDWFAFYSSPTRAWEFAVGGLTFLALNRRTRALPRPIGTGLFWLGLSGILVSCLVISEASVFPGWVVLIPVLSTAIVLAAGASRPVGIGSLTNRAMVHVGDASYSWYLWHWPLIAFGVMLFPGISWAPEAAAVLALALSLLTLRFLENRVRFSRRIQGRRVVWLAAGSVALVCLTSLTLIQGSRNAWGNEGIHSMMAQVSASHLWLSDGCNTATPLGERGPECTWNRDSDGAPIYLAGDSMAGALSEALLGAGQQLGRPIVVGTKGACPFIGVEMYLDGRPDTECNAFVSGSIDWLLKQPPSDVVLSSTLGYVVIDGVSFASTPGGRVATDQAPKTAAYLEGLGRTVARLKGAGHRVTVILPPPGFPATVMADEAWYPSQCATYEALADIAGCGASRSEGDVVAETAELFAQVTATVKSNGGQVLDPRAEICQSGTCSTNVGNDWLYLDGSHVSVSMSQRLGPFVAGTLAAAN